jgi:hypothetical protein
VSDEASLRGMLSVHRGSDTEAIDPRFGEARRKAESDSALSQWWTAEQEQDRTITAKLASVALPPDLKARLLLPPRSFDAPQRRWSRPVILAAACLIALAVLFGSWRGPFQPAVSLADYRDEMVGFIKVDPTLEMKSPNISQVTDWLQKNNAPSQLELPKKLQGLEPIGCRTLRFRGHDVGLICFKRKEGGLIHLFVVNRGALPGLQKFEDAQVAPERDWMTAVWEKGDMIYLMAAQGDQPAIESYLADA